MANGTLKSDDVVQRSFDQCLSDTLIKAGSTGVAGGILSLLLFRRFKLGVTLGAVLGVGMALANCQNKISSQLRSR